MAREKYPHWTLKLASAIMFTMLTLLVVLSVPADTHAKGPKPRITIATEFPTTLQPGVWHGFVLGPSSMKRAYFADISPQHASNDGAHIERYVVQPEYNGVEWLDVLRVQIPSTFPELTVDITVYAIEVKQ